MQQWEKESKISKEFSHAFYDHLEFSEWSKPRKTSPWVHIYYQGRAIDQKLHIPLNHTNFASKSSKILEQFIDVILS